MGKLVRKRIIEEVYEEPTDEVEDDVDEGENDDDEVAEDDATEVAKVALGASKKPRRRR